MESPHALPMNAKDALARMSSVEVRHYADGGMVQKTTERMFAKPKRAATELARMEHGGLVKGPGSGTSDSIPAMLSDGEIVLPADTVRKVGAARLLATIDATHEPTGKPPVKAGVTARADGGLLEDPGAVTRVGNSYSGGNVSGPITVNGQAPGGTVSTGDSAPTTSSRLAAPTPAKPAAATAAAPSAPLSAAPAVTDYANRNDAFNAGAIARSAAASQTQPLQRLGATAAMSAMPAQPTQPAPTPVPQAVPIVPPAQRADGTVRAFADGGLVQDPRRQAEADAAVQLAAYTPQRAMATMSDIGGGATPVMSAPAAPMAAPATPAAAPAPASAPASPTRAADLVAQIPTGGEWAKANSVRAAAPASAPGPAAAPAPGAAAVLASPAVATSAAAPLPPTPAPAAPEPSPTAAALLSQPVAPAAAEAPARKFALGSMDDTKAQLANLQASNAAVPRGGAVVLDTAAADADRRAQFNEGANLRNAQSQTTWAARRGTQGNDAAVQAALVPIDARAKLAQIAARDVGETQRAAIAEQGADARARLADTRAAANTAIDQQRLGLEGQKLTLDANRDTRAAAAATLKTAAEARLAQLQEQAATGTPAQRQEAAKAIAAMNGRDFQDSRVPVGYQRTADGGLTYIKGGPADPDTPKGKNNLTDTQGKALQFGSRMQAANDIFDELAKKGRQVSTPGANIPYVGNMLNSSEGQRLDQAKRNFLNAVLRRESGAVISPDEFASGNQQYFPQIGDSPDVIAQKRANRELSTRSILAEVPDAEKRVAQVRATAEPRDGAAATPPSPPRINSPADIENLPSGATFISPDGRTRRKP